MQDTPVIFYNIKPYCSLDLINNFIIKIIKSPHYLNNMCFFALPLTWLEHFYSTQQLPEKALLGANQLNSVSPGSFTEFMASKLLKEVGAKFALLGQNEKREEFGETNEQINAKMKDLLENDMIPFVCIGENLKEYLSSQSESVLREQITKAIEGISLEEVKQLYFIYEAPWVSKTLQAPTVEDLEKNFDLCKKVMSQIFGTHFEKNIKLLYLLPSGIKDLNLLLERVHAGGFYFDQPSVYTEIQKQDFHDLLAPFLQAKAQALQARAEEAITTAPLLEEKEQPALKEEEEFPEEEKEKLVAEEKEAEKPKEERLLEEALVSEPSSLEAEELEFEEMVEGEAGSAEELLEELEREQPIAAETQEIKIPAPSQKETGRLPTKEVRVSNITSQIKTQ